MEIYTFRIMFILLSSPSEYIDQQWVFVFGNNMFGQLGLSDSKIENDRDIHTTTKIYYEAVPQCLTIDPQIREVYCGLDHTCLLTDDGHVFVMGWNIDGQLGLGDMKDRSVPTSIPMPQNRKIRKLSVSTDMTLAIVGRSLISDELN